MYTSTPVMAPPQTEEPSEALLAVGSCATGPTPHSQPFVGFLGDRKAEKVVGPVPKGTVFASGWKEGCQISGRMVRVMMFHSSFRWIGMTGWTLRISCVPRFGPTR